MITTRSTPRFLSCSLLLVASSLLVACGGGSGSGDNPASSSAAASSSNIATSSSTAAFSSSAPAGSSSSVPSEPQVSDFIVVDQFGYRPDAAKIAVIRNPQTGYDASQSYAPGESLRLVNLETGATVHTGSASAWSSGTTYGNAGDQLWWFDFSGVTTPGRYAVVDEHNHTRSPGFRIANDVYRDVLVHAVRTFYYQRAGFAKQLPYAEAGWVDEASHLGANQDPAARLWNATGDASTVRDLRGGWYDAGDYNKYTNWHAEYLVLLLHTYLENPGVWTDDFGIPESGNGIPDLLDEVKWGMDWLIRMQEENGSVLSVMGLSHASPPSAATSASIYGPASTSASLSAAAAFAMGAKVFSQLGEDFENYASDLRERAEDAWGWAENNPEEIFENTGKIAAGEQEVNAAGRALKRRTAAVYLYAATEKADYRQIVETAFNSITWVGPWNEPEMTSLLYFASLPGVTSSVSNNIRTGYRHQVNNGAGNLPAFRSQQSGYRAYLNSTDFTWGSNRTMSRKGLSFTNLLAFGLPDVDEQEVHNAALGYLHYLHGTNPFGMVYLSNMYSLGVHKSVNEFYHAWFEDGSPQWDRVGVSTYGPAPGFLVGGPNPGYRRDSCCPNNCGGSENNNRCYLMDGLEPPLNQPPMKSYRDFNTSWPLNSWEITENHNDYQVAYIRLLSKFVP